MSNKPTVAIVGRPNVGKSTFVNRLVGARQSIVDDMPGVTRDRIYFDVNWQDKHFTVIDTGGIIPGDEDEIMVNIFAQVEIACEEADTIIFLVDGRDGVNPIDEDIAHDFHVVGCGDIVRLDEDLFGSFLGHKSIRATETQSGIMFRVGISALPRRSYRRFHFPSPGGSSLHSGRECRRLCRRRCRCRLRWLHPDRSRHSREPRS